MAKARRRNSARTTIYSSARRTIRAGVMRAQNSRTNFSRWPARANANCPSSSRCFCLVNDVVEALVRLQDCRKTRGEIFNIGGTEEVSMLELARLVVKTLGSKSKIELIPYDKAYPPSPKSYGVTGAPGFDDMRRRKPLVEKLERFVKFKPQTPLHEIIRLTAK